MPPLMSTVGSASSKALGFCAAVAAAPAFIDPLVFNATPALTDPGPINNYYRRYVYKVIFTAAEISAAGWTTSQTIRRISFYVTSQPTNQPYPNYAIGMINTALTVGSDFTTGITTVLNQSSRSFTVNQENILTLNTAFVWDGTSNLGVSVAWGQCPTGFTSSGVVRSNTGGTARYARTDAVGTYLVSNAASTTSSGRPCIRFYNTL
jgi:hypothetical protein